MKIAISVCTVVSIVLWGMCLVGWSGDKGNYLIAYLLKYPALLFSVISVVLFLCMIFKVRGV